MSTWIYFPIYSRGSHWDLSIKLITRHYTPRYILCCSTLPLCTKNRGSIRTICCNMSLIPINIWCNSSSTMSKSSILLNIYWRKCNFLPTTLPRTERNTATIFRLSRRIYKMKCCIFSRCNNILCSTTSIHLYYLRSTSSSTKNYCQTSYTIIYRMKGHTSTRLP